MRPLLTPRKGRVGLGGPRRHPEHRQGECPEHAVCTNRRRWPRNCTENRRHRHVLVGIRGRQLVGNVVRRRRRRAVGRWFVCRGCHLLDWRVRVVENTKVPKSTGRAACPSASGSLTAEGTSREESVCVAMAAEGSGPAADVPGLDEGGSLAADVRYPGVSAANKSPAAVGLSTRSPNARPLPPWTKPTRRNKRRVISTGSTLMWGFIRAFARRRIS